VPRFVSATTARSSGVHRNFVDVMAVIDWVRGNGSDELFVSNSLATLEPRFGPLAGTACGIIALELSRTKGNYVVWFRPEVVVTVNWGGNPSKPIEP
jgi:chemotaxis family two-component system sensor kinase Cph1